MQNIEVYVQKNKKKVIFIVSLLIIISTVTMIFLKKNTKNQIVNNTESITLERKNLINGISTSGVVISDNKTNIYSTLNAPVKEILVSVGDAVKKGDVLAVLDTSAIETEIQQAKLNYKSSLESLKESKKENENSIDNANTSLESTEISIQQQQIQADNAEKDLKKIEEKAKEPFNAYSYDFAIEEAKIAVENQGRNIKRMQEEEKDLRANLDRFDDSSYRNDISEKAILLERKKTELSNLRKDIRSQNRERPVFDEYNNKIAIDDANRSYNKKMDEYLNIQKAYNDIYNEYQSIVSNPESTQEEIHNITLKLNDIKEAQDKAKQELDELSITLERAKENLKRAKNEFDKSSNETILSNIKTTEKTYDQVRNEINDLEREYRKAVSGMNKAKQEALKSASAEYVKLQNTIKDAEYELVIAKNNFQKALLDKENAIREYIKTNENDLENAKRTLMGNQKQLESLNNNLKNAKNTVKQAKDKTISTVSRDINKVSLEKLESQLEKGSVIATGDGIITQVKAEVGTMSNDILFVIEDLDNVHIKANIKEHNLSSVDLGKKVTITTLASGDETFEGSVTFISPRAVSPIGSPVVEFEINAKPNSISSKIKPGMNAFLNIVVNSKENAFSVPVTAISKEDDGNYIYTIEDEKIPVEIGISTKTEVEIIGDKLLEGMKIKMNINEDSEKSIKNTATGGIF